MRQLITAHTLVKNEARFVWYSVASVIDFVDKILLWDTGSTDGTVEILRELKKTYPEKIELELLGSVNPQQFFVVRSKMLKATKTLWFLVVDGDEVWWDRSIRKLTAFLRSSTTKGVESVVVPTINLVGDMYHYQEEKAGHYHLAGRRGHLNLRAVNTAIPGLSSSNPHGTWGWTDKEGRMIQDRDSKGIKFIAAPYLHASFLTRADQEGLDRDVPKRIQKRKYEIGIPFSKDHYYPEVFFKDKPEIVKSPWEVMSWGFLLRAALETPLRKLRRRLLPIKEGY